MMLVGGLAVIVGADAPEPHIPITASAVLNADNSTTITVSGTWEWPTHGNRDCNITRYAVGWAIDWNDPNQPGNLVSGHGVTIYVGTPTDNTVHFDASDRKRDQVVLHSDNRTPFKELVGVLDAVSSVKRDLRAPDGQVAKIAAFNTTFAVR